MHIADLSWFSDSPMQVFDLFEFMADESKSDSENKGELIQYLNSCGLDEDSSGAYVFAADVGELGNEKQGFLYPFSRSVVYYIGKTDAPHQRFLSHFSGAGWAADDLWRNEYGSFSHRHLPRYTYAAKYGAWVHWWPTKGAETAEQLETRLMMAFYRKHGSIPVANLKWSKLEDLE